MKMSRAKPEEFIYSAILDSPTHDHGAYLETKRVSRVHWAVDNELQGDEAREAASHNAEGANLFPMSTRNVLALEDDGGIALELEMSFSTDFLSGRSINGELFNVSFGRRQLEGFFKAVRQLECEWRNPHSAAGARTPDGMCGDARSVVDQVPTCTAFPGEPPGRVESSTSLKFFVQSSLDGLTYPEQKEQEREQHDWYLRVTGGEPAFRFDPGETGDLDGYEVEIAQSFQLYGPADDPRLREGMLKRTLNLNELRSLFAGMTELRRRMVAAGLPV